MVYASNFLEIAVIDDDQVGVSSSIAEILNTHGYRVSVVQPDSLLCVTEADEKPDLVFVYIDQIKDEIGPLHELLSRLEVTEGSSVIAIIPNTDSHVIEAALAFANDYIGLPLNETELLSKVAVQSRRLALQKGLLARVTELRRDYDRLSSTLYELSHTNNYDRETGLVGHQLALAYLEEALLGARRAQATADILLIEVDVELTNLAAERNVTEEQCIKWMLTDLSCLLVKCDLVARVSRNRLLVVFDGPFSHKAAQYYRDEIGKWIREGESSSSEYHTATVLISGAQFPTEARTADQMLRHAEDGLDIARITGNSAEQEHSLEIIENSDDYDAQIQADILKAKDRNQFHLYFQPQVDAISHRVIGCEVLMRWIHPELGFVSPDKFIPILEENGLINQVGAWLIEQSINQHLKWIADGFNPIRIGVNFSILQLADPHLGEWLASLLEASEVAAPWFELEITETATVSNFEIVKANLRRARGLGMQVAVDDFGTGNATLNYLQQLPVDVIKIDRQFIRGVTDSSQDAVLLKAIVSLASTIGKDVIAEGVETLEQAHFLAEAGCKELQGYYFGKPMPADDFENYLESNAGAAVKEDALPDLFNL